MNRERRMFVLANEPIGAKIILLGGDKFAIVDPADYENLSRFRWRADQSERVWYAARFKMIGGRARNILMHRLLLNAPPGVEVDHRNGNGLDNRRANIRLCTHVENSRNRHSLRLTKASRWKGVVPYASQIGTRWRARIHVSGKNLSLGSYGTEEEAARAYDTAAREHFGEFAALNYPGVTPSSGSDSP